MALPKIAEVRSLSDEEISEEILAVKRELFQLRLEQATRRLEKPHLFKHSKHRLAQLLTVERERELAAIRAEPESESATTSATEE
ncbi:50S ribosomal protein L29 [Myxosarcina sp. GI1]|uniref:50S ribosomal protein L29 n=1 Tax=Myxosarcina sp. GI1 TaxID=1541065 RepID=UPI0005672DB0|nr:50S ribosomal protein L29 [Myxosarcina sp. GI1]